MKSAPEHSIVICGAVSRVTCFLFFTLAVAFGFVPVATSAESGIRCEDNPISATAVRTREDVPAFVQCAYEFAQRVGFEEAKRAFHEDERWFSGETFIFVDQLALSGDNSLSLVYPPDPSKVGTLWGAFPSYGSDLTAEQYRVATTFGRGWIYYKAGTHVTGLQGLKATYIIRMNWDGYDAAIAAGIYPRDIPGNCHPDLVNARLLDAMPSDQKLEEFVTCAARRVESYGYFAKAELEADPRWRNGSVYVFALDLMGNQVFTGTWRGMARHEWGGKSTAQFLGRDMIDIADEFGESYIYYRTLNPATGQIQRKTSFIKRVLAQGVPILVGAGYYLDAQVNP